MHLKIKIHYVGNLGSVVLHHFEEFGKRGNLLMVLMFEIFLSKLLNNVGFQENIQVINDKWDYNNLKRGDPPYLQFLPCLFDGLNQLIKIKNWLEVVFVGKHEIYLRACIIGVVKWSRWISWIYCYSYVVCCELYPLSNKVQKGTNTISFLVTRACWGIQCIMFPCGY